MSSYTGIEGRVALITGAAGGIGESTAYAFAAAGAKLMLADFDEERGRTVAAKIVSEGGSAEFTACDVADEAQVKALVERTVSAFGSLDFAHNNAGVTGVNAKLADQEFDTWNKVIGVNLTGVFLCLREELRVMIEQGNGAIVNTASNAGFRGFEGLGPYVASKHGVIGMTKSAAVEYGPLGLRINAVCPGATESPMLERVLAHDAAIAPAMTSRVPLGRFGRAQDIAEAVVWLCSDSAAYITGTTLLVDGGNTAA
jgi:NAD(P)-dependent dehydrogenase (short-subunit alcohol dehydrogenase family)